MLRHLGLSELQLLSAPLHFNALSGFNLHITDFLAAPGR
jgi:3,4-dihydroxy 2-butanone 4-phosphate synthase/GTP cyclohydrolase II